MKIEDYKVNRTKLLDEAQTLIDSSKLEDATAKTKEIEALDKQFEDEATALANLNALKDNNKVVDIAGNGVGKVIANFGTSAESEDMYDSVEYRKAFMANVIKGTALPAKFQNSDANTKSSDVGSVIPTTIMAKIIEKMESSGMILPLITKTSYKGGVSIPTSSVKPVATWVSEGAGSDKQKKATGSITFTYYKLRCAISISLEVSNATMGIFETTFAANVAEAMLKAQEQSVIDGNGTTQPKGILKETVVTGQNVNVAKADKLSYQTLIDAEAALPLAYESKAVWCMTKKTFMAFIGMTDLQKQPVARVNYGIAGKPERTLLGRTVVLNDYMQSYADTVEKDTVVAFLFNFEDYVLNTNYAITVKQYEDNDTDDQVTKAVMLVDGKVVDKNSLVTVTKTLL